MQRFLDVIKNVWRPHPGQLEFLLNPAKYKVLACGRRWGKTDVCAVQTVCALLRPFPTKHLILGPTLDQAMLVFDRVVEMLEKLGESVKGSVRRSPYPKLLFGPHSLTARSGHLLRALRGNEATCIVVDEAAHVPESLITEIAMPMLATTDGSMTLISTPYGRNHFWRFFEMGQRAENGFWSKRAPSSESPHVSPSFLHIQRQLLSEQAFAVEYEAAFVDTIERVFKTDTINACLVETIPPLTGPYVIGVDWARYGDFTTIAVLSGTRDKSWIAKLDRFQGLTWTRAVERVAETIEMFPNPIVTCDATGVGDPVLEQLQAKLPSVLVKGFVFTSPSKATLIDNLVWLLEREALKFEHDPRLIEELENFQVQGTVQGRSRLGARGGHHDDLVIALALAASELSKAYRPQISLGKERTFTNTPEKP